MEQRVEFVALVAGDHVTMAEACRRFSVSRKTGYKWLERYEAGGFEGLKEQSRAPKTHPQAISSAMAKQLLEARRSHPHWGARTIVRWLARRHAGMLPSASTVTELFKRHGLVPSPASRPKHQKAESPQPDFSAPNRTWCADFKGQFQMRDRSWCFPLTITDGYSRFLLCCKGLVGTASEPTQEGFRRCFLEHGLPDAILTDNGLPFASTAVGRLSRLSVWWIKLGIRLHRIVPGKPQQNGRHERMHRTLKQETADAPARTLALQQPVLDRFRAEYNYERPHAALDGRSPGHLYQPSSRPMPRKVCSPDYPGHQAVRSVHTDGSFNFRGDVVFLSEALVGEPIGLQEFDDDRFLIRFGPVELAVLDCRGPRPLVTRLTFTARQGGLTAQTG